MPAYRAMPATGGNFPVILVVQEVFGVHEHIKDVCRRLAKAGLLRDRARSSTRARAIPSKYTDIPEADLGGRGQGARRAGDGRPRRHRRVRQEHRQGRGRAPRHHRLLLGWAHRPHVRRAQPEREGRGARGMDRPRASSRPATRRRSTSRARSRGRCSGLYGGADGGIPNDTVEKMFAAIKASGNAKSEYTIYPDTPHAFNADYRPSYRKQQADDAWQKMIAWFKLNRSHLLRGTRPITKDCRWAACRSCSPCDSTARRTPRWRRCPTRPRR